MTFFVGLLNQEGDDLGPATRMSYEALPRSLGLRLQWHVRGAFSALIATSDVGNAELAEYASCVGVGTVRLDNRADVARWAHVAASGLTDLALIVRLLGREGSACVPRLQGDFAFVVWDARARVLVAARDALGVKCLFRARRNGVIMFASRAEALSLRGEYDAQYLAELVAFCPPAPGRSAYANVHAVGSGTLCVHKDGRLADHQYWSPYNFEPGATRARSEQEAAETCRELLAESVALRLTGKADTWAQLSGGMDSSSVVSIAQWLMEAGKVAVGLSGSVTWVDKFGMGGDEREYSNTVSQRYGLRSEVLTDIELWGNAEDQPPRLDQPTGAFATYPKWYRLRDVVQSYGGRVLLTGIGGDELFRGNMLFFADWLAAGRLGDATREMLRRAAIGRASFWELAFKNAVVPLLPRRLQHRSMGRLGQIPSFIKTETARRYGLHSRTRNAASFGGRLGHKYSDAMAKEVTTLPHSLNALSIIEQSLELRHPFLYQPLVEFARGLPPEFCVRPHARKWILRQAMQGVLPEAVRGRVGKASTSGLIHASLLRHRQSLAALVDDPLLAKLDVVDRDRFRTAFTTALSARYGTDHVSEDVQYALAVEAWLQVRSGRWPHEAGPRSFSC